MNRGKRKKSGRGIIIIALCVIYALYGFLEDQPGYYGIKTALRIISGILVVAYIVVTIAGRAGRNVKMPYNKIGAAFRRISAQAQASGKKRDISAPLTKTEKSAAGEYERYVRQLDGFLKNGIIERTEYNFLMEKYRRELKK